MIRASQKGFTIVELLIVIVVIGILAAITIVAFNGVQERAKNSNTTAVVRQYDQALRLYLTEKGSYPGTGCYGEGYLDSSCWTGPNGVYAVNATLNTAIRPYMDNKNPLPSTDRYLFTSTDDVRGGVVVQSNSSWTLDGEPMLYRIVYYVKGRVCEYGKVLAVSGTAHSTTNANRYSSYAGGGFNLSQCIIPLPNP